MKYTKKEIDNYILKFKNCIGLNCDECYYNNVRCSLDEKIHLYKKCTFLNCDSCDYGGECRYNYLTEIKKLDLIRKILT